MSYAFRPLLPHDLPDVENLFDVIFGYGRYAKTAQRLRENNSPSYHLSQTAYDAQGMLIGALLLWPLNITADGAVHSGEACIGSSNAFLLGPMGVLTAYRGQNLGRVMLAKITAGTPLLLIGDIDYYSPLGFKPVGHLRLPGPVNKARLLARDLTF